MYEGTYEGPIDHSKPSTDRINNVQSGTNHIRDPAPVVEQLDDIEPPAFFYNPPFKVLRKVVYFSPYVISTSYHSNYLPRANSIAINRKVVKGKSSNFSFSKTKKMQRLQKAQMASYQKRLPLDKLLLLF